MYINMDMYRKQKLIVKTILKDFIFLDLVDTVEFRQVKRKHFEAVEQLKVV